MIEGIEWLIIGLIVVLLVFYDPKKIPQIARAITQAKQEYEKAVSTLKEEVTSIQEEPEKAAEEKPVQYPYDREPESIDLHMIRWAKMYNIKTYGKTKEEIRQEIFKKAKEYFFESKRDLKESRAEGQEAGKEELETSGQQTSEPAEAKSEDEKGVRD